MESSFPCLHQCAKCGTIYDCKFSSSDRPTCGTTFRDNYGFHCATKIYETQYCPLNLEDDASKWFP